MNENQKIYGLLNSDFTNLHFNDLQEIFLSSIILMKLKEITGDSVINIDISLHDLYPEIMRNTLENHLENKEISSSNRITKEVTDFMNFEFGSDLIPKITKEPAYKYFNDYFTNRLAILKKGDGLCIEPATIKDFQVDYSNKLNKFKIILIPNEFLKKYSNNVNKYLEMIKDMYHKFKNVTGSLETNVSYRKQLEFLIDYLEKRQSLTAEIDFDFKLSDFNFRHSILSYDSPKGTFTMPSPLAMNKAGKVILQFFLETQGIIDVNGIKLVNKDPLDIENIDIIYSVSKPSKTNRFLSKSMALEPEIRKSMNETQLLIFERIYTKNKKNYLFGNRPLVEKYFANLTSWLLKKTSYCLEDPSFLKEKSEEWLTQHSSDNYKQMEDNFFLPFLFEKLKYDYGDIIIKKPESFGGEIDIMFGDIPIELKVRKKENEPLIDNILEDKFKPASQAAAYAYNIRVGFVVVLDLPESNKQITNLDNCVKIIEKEFDSDNFYKTVINLFIFYCNQPIPSSAS